MATTTDFDVIVIGAGISGIYSAKFYLDTHPHCRLAILDRDDCVGGTWNSRRSYDEFWTQWTVGTAEYSDFPMPRPPEEDIYYESFKAKHTTNYLESYVDHHKYAGQTLRNRINFSTEVQSAEKENGKWILSAKHRINGTRYTFRALKLLVASGLTSIPNMPSFSGEADFGGPIVHHENFGSANVLSSPDIKKISVIGGGKSSADMVYSAVKAGKSVTWLLKETETTGPGFFLSPKGKGPYKTAFELAMTRIVSTLTPSFMNGDSWWTKFLHSTSIGVKIVKSFWKAVDAETRKDANFECRENSKGFEKLTPHSPIFWSNATGGLLNHADFFEVIADNVQVECADIDALGKGQIHLKNGATIPADALLCGTGWLPSLQFFSEDMRRQLGLPHLLTIDTPEESKHWAELESVADQRVTRSFPQLADPPPHWHRPVTSSPYRLYRLAVPISNAENLDRSIAFIGQVGVADYFPVVECQAMWTTAYLDGKLSLPSMEDQEKEVALFTTWCKRRYLSTGETGNELVFETMGYIDGLLEDLGLVSHRRGWFKDLFGPFLATQFAGLKEEYFKKYGYDQKKI
ncbi:hypothetical protein B7494_g5910 [Chlorociboria aeruginascens]|nr:hypothetical protein B7494_g5910 [Chlorociboria aeruginascens]